MATGIRPEDMVPPHDYIVGGTGTCLVCGRPEGDVLHDLGPEVDEEIRESLPAGDANRLEASDGEEGDVEEGQTGVMVALFPSQEVAQQLRLPGGEKAKNIHLTLAYLGDADMVERPDELVATVQQWASEEGKPLSGEVAGIGVFTAGPGAVTYASVDLPDLPALRQGLVQVLAAAGFPASETHGFTPHMTLAYADRRDALVPNVPLYFDSVVVAIAGRRVSIPLGDVDSETAGVYKKHAYVHPNGERPAGVQHRDQIGYGYAYPPCADCGLSKDDPNHTVDSEDTGAGVDVGGTTSPNRNPSHTGVVTAVERVEPEYVAPEADAQRAFVAEINGRTLITAPATLDTHGWEKALTPNPHFMWMQGRFVGGEEPNRNRAMWSTQDLEFGEPTVAHGPLNWLHESRHIIGTIADQRLVKPTVEQAAVGNVPYIAAVAGIWKWIYPDEAYVVEQASDSNKLWYSMECVSREVECAGESGCGATASYGDYMKGVGGSCGHMRERSQVRRFVDPTFLGGAVIVPPVRPGWADADARVMREAASLAERSFEQVHPDVTASEWELLMSQVVMFARP